MKGQLLSLKFLAFIFVSIFLISCEQEKEIYERPEWLGGSSIETLTEEGDCDIYLELMEKANYTEPITKQLFTLFVPRDSAFQEYFKKIGVSSVDELTEDEAVQLFTLHVLRNPRSRFQLIYEWVWGELQGPNGEYAALFFRKQTNSFSLPYKETVVFDPAYEGETLIIDPRTDKWIPLFSTDFMEDYFASTDGSDYEFIYKNSTWGGLNWHNAMVTESEVRTASGFIYYLDQVVPPMPSIEEHLKDNQDKYGVYYDLIQRFARYRSAGTNEKDERVYRKQYINMMNLASDAGPSAGGELQRQDMFTAYIPKDDVMQTYLDEKVFPYYPAVDSMPEVTLYYIVQSHITPKLNVKSKIKKGVYNAFGDIIDIDPDSEITDAYMCSNGVLYEMNRVLEANVFTTVPGPLFFNSNYTTFLYALASADMINAISNPELDVTVLAPSNEQLAEYGIRYNVEDNIMQYKSRSGLWTNYKEDDLILFVENHIINENMTNFSGEGYIELSNGNYAYYNNNTLKGAGNYEDNDNTGFTEKIEDGINGTLYYLDNVLKEPDLTAAEWIGKDPDLSEVFTLLSKSELLDTIVDPDTYDTLANLAFLGETRYWTMFLPDNNAIEEARSNGDIPEDPQLLKDFLFYHFINGDVIFDDGNKSGLFRTNYSYLDTISDEIIYGQLDISNASKNLRVTDEAGNQVNINHEDANNLVNRGVVHKISAILKRE